MCNWWGQRAAWWERRGGAGDMGCFGEILVVEVGKFLESIGSDWLGLRLAMYVDPVRGFLGSQRSTRSLALPRITLTE